MVKNAKAQLAAQEDADGEIALAVGDAISFCVLALKSKFF